MTTPKTDEPDDLVTCRGCGESVSVSIDRAFVLDEQDALCLDCATKRGGRYDDETDRWTIAPQVGDLATELAREQ